MTKSKSQTPSKIATPATTRAPMASDVLALELREAKMTDSYIITKPMGTSKRGPLERWFEKARLCKYMMAKGGAITIHTHRSYLATRGIDHANLPVITAAEASVKAA